MSDPYGRRWCECPKCGEAGIEAEGDGNCMFCGYISPTCMNGYEDETNVENLIEELYPNPEKERESR